MLRVPVQLKERSYDILIGADCLKDIGHYLKDICPSKTVALISNPVVFTLYGKQIEESLKRYSLTPFTIIIPDGEQYKDFFWAYHILTQMLQAGLDRGSAVIALGGGVVGDIAAFCASVYMRGINLVQIPTTLLAQVDSSVGGKTGVNHLLGKNMIGTFYQPKLVLIDVNTLRTLPKREFLAGLAEVIKYGIILDKEFFYFLTEARKNLLKLEPSILIKVIKRCCELKANVVSKDETEAGLRAILNYGHTIGHAIETQTNYKEFLHGEAVAIGMAAEAKLSELLGYLSTEDTEKIVNTISSYELPVGTGFDIEASSLLNSMRIDKKTRKGSITFILPEQIGRVRIEKAVSESAILEVLAMLKEGRYV